jgi:hypothetical protein
VVFYYREKWELLAPAVFSKDEGNFFGFISGRVPTGVLCPE